MERSPESVRRDCPKACGEVARKSEVRPQERARRGGRKTGRESVVWGKLGKRGKASLFLQTRRRRTARRSARATPENRRNAVNLREAVKTRGIFPPLLFSGVLWKSTIKNAKKYNSFRRFVEYLPVFDTPSRPFQTTVGFVRGRVDTAGCGGDGAQRVRQVVVASGCAGAGGGVRERTG